MEKHAGEAGGIFAGSWSGARGAEDHEALRRDRAGSFTMAELWAAIDGDGYDDDRDR